MIAWLRKRMTPAGLLTRPQWLPNPSKIFLDGQFRLDPEVFGPDQVAFARGMDVEHVNYRSWKRETKRYVVAESD
jgi:hypothetical protein